MDKIIEEMEKRSVTPFDLQETDTWVNDATFEDIKRIAERYNYKVFGLNVSSLKKIRGRGLLKVRTFQVDYIFKKEDEEKVNSIISEYLNSERHLKPDLINFIDKLSKLAIYTCIWV